MEYSVSVCVTAVQAEVEVGVAFMIHVARVYCVTSAIFTKDALWRHLVNPSKFSFVFLIRGT